MSFNKIILIGNLTRDPELSAIPSGLQVCKFTLAVNHRTKDKEEVCFIDVAAWGKQAEFVAQYFRKGKPILVEGRLKLDTWVKDGKQMSKHNVIAEAVSFIGTQDKQVAEPMVNESKRIAPLPYDIKQAQAVQFTPPSGQKEIGNNNLDADELPF
jgi:single-strand DNA-binding protein